MVHWPRFLHGMYLYDTPNDSCQLCRLWTNKQMIMLRRRRQNACEWREEKQTIVVRSETLVGWPDLANERAPLSPRTNERQRGGQGLGSRGSDCWHPENWCPATRSRDTAETPPALPGLSVLCSVQPMSDHWGYYSQKGVKFWDLY